MNKKCLGLVVGAIMSYLPLSSQEPDTLFIGQDTIPSAYILDKKVTVREEMLYDTSGYFMQVINTITRVKYNPGGDTRNIRYVSGINREKNFHPKFDRTAIKKIRKIE